MTDKQPEALRLADWLEADACDLQTPRDAAAELRRLHEENEALQRELRLEQTVSFRSQVHEQADRITALETANKELLEALHHISLCSQNSMSSQRQCGEIARAAIAKHGGEA